MQRGTYIRTPEHRLHQSLVHIGQMGHPVSIQHRRKLSRLMLGNKRGKNLLGIKRSIETRLKISGPNHYNWKGGIYPENEKIRNSIEMIEWRKKVFERDNYACVIGGKAHGHKLHADHIKPFSLYPELRFVLSNGRTLCEDCHKKTPTYGGRSKNKIL